MSATALRTIGEFADQHGISVRAVRLYEQRGLLGSARIADARRYDHRDDARLATILRAKRMGLSLAEIGRFCGLLESAPSEMDAAARRQMQQLLERQMNAFVARRRALDAAIDELRAALATRDLSKSA